MGKGRSDGKIFTYSITLDGGRYGDFHSNIQAETPAKAKYIHYNQYGEFFDNYREYISYNPKVKKIGEFKPQDLFEKETEFSKERWEKIKKYRMIPFLKLGMKVEVDGKKGIVTGGNSSCNIEVCMQGETYSSNCHPNWRIKYFDNDGKIIKEFGE